ncbi:hypothetical protein YC2023_002020 [Brassica napus]
MSYYHNVSSTANESHKVSFNFYTSRKLTYTISPTLFQSSDLLSQISQTPISNSNLLEPSSSSSSVSRITPRIGCSADYESVISSPSFHFFSMSLVVQFSDILRRLFSPLSHYFKAWQNQSKKLVLYGRNFAKRKLEELLDTRQSLG